MKIVRYHQPQDFLQCSYAPCPLYCAQTEEIKIGKQASEKLTSKMIFCRQTRTTGKFDVFCSHECHDKAHNHSVKEAMNDG